MRVPRAEEEPDAALWGQVAPEAPVFRPLALFLGRRSVGARDQPARIHPLAEQVDALALAGAVDAAEDNDYRKARIGFERALYLEQFFAQRGDLRPVVGTGDFPSQFRCFEHVNLRLSRP